MIVRSAMLVYLVFNGFGDKTQQKSLKVHYNSFQAAYQLLVTFYLSKMGLIDLYTQMCMR